MVEPVHHIPGRLRIKSRHFKTFPKEAARLAGRIEQMRGVRSVALSALTGSMVIYYDPRTIDEGVLLGALRAQVPAAQALGEASSPAKRLVPLAGRVGASIASAILQTVLERSAVAFIVGLV